MSSMRERLVPFIFCKYYRKPLIQLLDDVAECEYLCQQPWIHAVECDEDLTSHIDIRDRILRRHPHLLSYVPQSQRQFVASDIIGGSVHLGNKELHSSHSIAWGYEDKENELDDGEEEDVKDSKFINEEPSSEEETFCHMRVDNERYRENERNRENERRRKRKFVIHSDSDEEQACEETSSNEYEVEVILKHQKRKQNKCNVTYYLIKWSGYPSSENTWEPEENISTDLLFVYWKRRYFSCRRK